MTSPRAIFAVFAASQGPSGEPIRIWGRQRLLSLARLLPLLDRVDVHLLGTGFPSFWVARLGEMRFTLGLSGWTANDWTRGSALDALAPPAAVSPDVLSRVAQFVRLSKQAAFGAVCSNCALDAGQAASSLNQLAHAGQLICDLGAGVFRWRQVMPVEIAEMEMGPESPEVVASRELLAGRRARLESELEPLPGRRLCTGKVDGKPVELLLDTDGTIRRGKCLCGHHQMAGLRKGPCRHLLALRSVAMKLSPPDPSSASWYDRLARWAQV